MGLKNAAILSILLLAVTAWGKIEPFVLQDIECSVTTSAFNEEKVITKSGDLALSVCETKDKQVECTHIDMKKENVISTTPYNIVADEPEGFVLKSPSGNIIYGVDKKKFIMGLVNVGSDGSIITKNCTGIYTLKAELEKNK